MFRLEVNQKSGELNFNWVRDKKAELEKPNPCLNKEKTTASKETRAKICDEGLIPTSNVYKQTQKVTIEYKENDKLQNITVERMGVKQEFSWPKEWDYKMVQDGVTVKFRAPTPDAILAYEYYFNQVKKDVLKQQLENRTFGQFPSAGYSVLF